MYRSSSERERIGRSANSRNPYHLTTVIDLKRDAVQPFAEGPQICDLVFLPEGSMENPPPSQGIGFSRFRTSHYPATRIDSADIAVIAAWKRTKIGKDTFVPSKNVGSEAARDTTEWIRRGCIRFSREHSPIVKNQ
jgi:hypothetical protein